MLKKILLALMFVITATTGVTYAEDDMKTVASKAYVDTQIETKQLKIPAANQPNVGAGETVMTYTSNGNGEIGERGLYSDISSYNATTDGDKLITASALNATFTNLPTTPTTKLECANQADGCTLWTIVDQTAYGDMLPSGYTRLEYIEATSDAPVIQLGISGNMKFSFVAQSSRIKGSSQALLASTPTASAGSWFGEAVSSRTWGVGADTTMAHTTIPPTTKISGTISFDSSGSRGVINDETVTRNVNISQRDWCLFNSCGGGFPFFGKVWELKAYQNDYMVGDFIPARRNSDGVLGMYDTVSGTFKENAGTGTFTAGPDM